MPRELKAPETLDRPSGRDVPRVLLVTALVVAGITTTLFLAIFPYSVMWVLSTWLAWRVTESRGRGRELGAALGFLLSVVGLVIASLIPRRREVDEPEG